MLKKTVLLTIVVAAMLVPAASAGHRADRPYPEDRIVVLSTELLDATRDMRYDVRRRARGHHGRANGLLASLDRLENRARYFRRDAVRGAPVRRLDRRLDALIVSFEHADREMRFVRSARLQRDFSRVERTMRRLARQVEYAAAPIRPRHGRRAHGGIILGDGGLHGEVVLGDRTRNGRYKVRIRF